MSYLMGLDIGGGGGRCLLVNTESGETTSAFRAWSFPVAPETGNVGFDIDLDALWSSLCEAAQEALAKSGASSTDVKGVAVAAFRFGTVILDGNGEAVYAGPNRDGRAAMQGMSMAGEYGDEVAAATGRYPNPAFAVSRVLWLKDVAGDEFAKAKTVLAANDWVAYKLCGELATDFSQAGETGVFDLKKRQWASDVLEKVGLSPSLFPAVKQAGSLLGKLTGESAAALGLNADTAVAVGGADTQCGLLGIGAVNSGDLAIVAGTTAPIQWVTEQAEIDPANQIWSGQHVTEGQFLLEANAGPVGDALDWMGNTMYATSPSPAAALLGDAAAAAPGARGVQSTFGVSIHDARAVKVPIGSVTLSHLFTAPETDRSDMARSVVEGLAFGLKKNLELLETLRKDKAAKILLAGGMSRSGLFAQILADVSGVPVEVGDCNEATALGAAICAGVAAGVFSDLGAGATQLAKRSRVFTPGTNAEKYASIYSGWSRLHTAQAAADEVAQELKIGQIMEGMGQPEAETASVKRTKIFVSAAMDDEGIAALEELGDVTYQNFRETHNLLTGNSLVQALQGYEVFICEVDPVDVGAIQKCKELRVIATCRGDPVNIDIPGMGALGIPVINAPGRNADAVADLTIGFAISMARKLAEAGEFLRDEDVEAGDLGKMGAAFSQLQGKELWRKTFGLVGFGAIGKKVAARLVPFGVKVIVSDPFVTPEIAALHGATKVEFDELLETADFVSLHVPVTKSTTGMMGVEQFAKMKPGSFFINSARAALIDEQALVDTLEDEHLGGAAVDVFAVEPPGWDHPLLDLENVIATPHVGGNTFEVATHQGRIIAEDLKRILSGQKPRYALNPECLEAFDMSQPRVEASAEELAKLASDGGPATTDLAKAKNADKTTGAAARRSDEDEDEDEDYDDDEEDAMGIPEENRQIMASICREFVQGIITDDEIKKTEVPPVTLHFNISDIGEEFWFALDDGKVSGGMGPPKEDADVQLKMGAYILDGMFTGKINAMEKAMAGELSFMGDASKAMTLQEMQSSLGRLYKAGREKYGDPGDLEKLAKEGPPKKKGRKGKRAGATATVVAAGPVKKRVGDERDDLCDVVEELYGIELITATGGNVSVKASTGDDEYWITPSAMFKGNLDPETMVRISNDGKKVGEGGTPSSERMVHLAMYEARPNARAVIHCHAPHATILANTGLPFLPISTEAAFFGEIARIPFIMPGTPDLASAVGEAAKNSHAVLMTNHGLVVAGLSLRKCADMVEVVERTAEIILGCYAVGKEPPVLPADDVKKLREMGTMMA
ncbi:MAG: class II aldolase/adducin family protein [Polyangiaceae bacterium]|nr:class II aldolase/adducin family protein [Polyangiaceae bacterium]